MHETKKERDGQKERDRADSKKERDKAGGREIEWHQLPSSGLGHLVEVNSAVSTSIGAGHENRGGHCPGEAKCSNSSRVPWNPGLLVCSLAENMLS